MIVLAPATRRHRLLLGALVLIWAVSWPVIKVGIATVPPLWFGCLRYVVATICLFAFVAARGDLALPSRSDMRLVAASGALQMGALSALTGLALTIVPPGRASVLAFSTPLWVVPLAAWAISIVVVRGHRFDASPLTLAPWQMLVAAALLCPLAIIVEGRPHAIGARGIASLAYVGPMATAFTYWAVVEVGRAFRAATISMALLATPGLGLLISALTLHEIVTTPLAAGIILVAAGIRLAVIDAPRIPSRVAPSQRSAARSPGGRLG